jgi:Skp family chaperone for outer membrane proteins
MTNMDDVVQVLKKERDRLSRQLQGISAALSAFGAAYTNGNGASRTISAAGKARIAAAQKARWAKVKGTQAKSLAAPTKRRTMSAASRKKIRGTTRSVGEGKGC